MNILFRNCNSKYLIFIRKVILILKVVVLISKVLIILLFILKFHFE